MAAKDFGTEFTFIEIGLSSLVAGLVTYLAIKLIFWRFLSSRKRTQDIETRSWTELLLALEPSDGSIARNNRLLCLLATSLSHRNYLHLQNRQNTEKTRSSSTPNDSNTTSPPNKPDPNSPPPSPASLVSEAAPEFTRLRPLDWFHLLDHLVAVVPYSRPSRSLTLLGDLLLTVLLPNAEEQAIAYHLKASTPMFVLTFHQDRGTSTRAIVCRELTRWLDGLDPSTGHPNSQPNYSAALLWFLFRYHFFRRCAGAIEEGAEDEDEDEDIDDQKSTKSNLEAVAEFLFTATMTAWVLGPDVVRILAQLLELFDQLGPLRLRQLINEERIGVLEQIERPTEVEVAASFAPDFLLRQRTAAAEVVG